MTSQLVFWLTLLVVSSLLLAEYLRAAPPTDWARNLQTWALYLFCAATLLPLLPEWKGVALADGGDLPFLAGFALFLFVKDFGEYIFHRAQHRIPLLWAMHSLHHSDPEMAVLTTGRHFWGDQVLKQTSRTATCRLISAAGPG
jgi:sterol desaturase/sphingolipid hydroxylase (fatty acid hydroxylase superfamily)